MGFFLITLKTFGSLFALLVVACCVPIASIAQTIPDGAAIDGEVGKIMARTRANGMAVAVVDHGKVGYVHAYGIRNAKGDPLTTDTVMYGASLTKSVFAYTVMQLVDQGKIKSRLQLKRTSTSRYRVMGPIRSFPTNMGRTRISLTILAGKRSRRRCA
jgi:D-alanyl-D-alanine carboxypeptidase